MINDMALQQADDEVSTQIQILRKFVDGMCKRFAQFDRSEHMRTLKQELQTLAESIKA